MAFETGPFVAYQQFIGYQLHLDESLPVVEETTHRRRNNQQCNPNMLWNRSYYNLHRSS